MAAEKNRMLSAFESMHFFFEARDKPDHEKRKKWIREVLGDKLTPALTEIVGDIAIMISDERTNPRYEAAVRRYLKHYSNLAPTEMRELYRYLCSSFNIPIPEMTATLKPEELPTPGHPKMLI